MIQSTLHAMPRGTARRIGSIGGVPPAESPDLNPIEDMWHELKEYIRREVKLKTKEELIDGIKAFWSTVDIEKCRKYIRHLLKSFLKL